MKKIFIAKINPRIRPNKIIVKIHNTTTYEDKSLTTGGPTIWNSLPQNKKSQTVLVDSKNTILNGSVTNNSNNVTIVKILPEKPRLLLTQNAE